MTTEMRDTLKTIHETERFRFVLSPEAIEISTLDWNALINPKTEREAALLSIAFKRCASHLEAIGSRLLAASEKKKG